MKYTMILLSLLVLAATSCKKDDDNDEVTCQVSKQVDNNTGVITTVSYQNGRVYRVEQSNGNSGQVTFNADGRISLYEIFVSNVKVGYAGFEYTASGELLERNTFQVNLLGQFTQRLRDVYEYTAGRVTKVTNYDYDYSQTSVNSYNTYEYNGAGNVTKEDQYGRDGANNIILKSSISFQYDDKQNPAGDLAQYLNLFSNNNVTVRNTTTYFPNASNTIDTIEYVYNEFGYPTRVTTFQDGGGVYSYDVDYNCN